MRINRSTLLRAAEDAVDRRVKESRTVLAAYLHGSLNREGDPLIGECGDVDIVFVHEYAQDVRREIVRLTDGISLDIAHHTRQDYRQPRELRTRPWLGPAIYGFKILHDPRHFLDFVQAGLRDQFFRPGNVLARAQRLQEKARNGWTALLGSGEGSTESVLRFVEVVGDAANAIAGLEGEPMPERRLLARFFERTEQLGQPGLYTSALELLGAGEVDVDDLQRWLLLWETAFRAASSEAPAAGEWGLHPARESYYRAAIRAQLDSERPADALWALLRTWARAVSLLPGASAAREGWTAAMEQAGLLGADFPGRLGALDGYLDLVEEILEAWGRARGVAG